MGQLATGRHAHPDEVADAGRKAVWFGPCRGGRKPRRKIERNAGALRMKVVRIDRGPDARDDLAHLLGAQPPWVDLDEAVGAPGIGEER